MRTGKALSIFTFISILILILGCENEYPPSIYDKESEGNPSPEITSVEPAEGAFAGIDDITITGKSFSSSMDEIFVYFNGTVATILSASTTQLLVRAPIIEGDSLTIKVAVLGAYLFAEWSPYRIQYAAIEYGGVNDLTDAYGIACDILENIYVSSGLNTIIKISPDEESTDFASTPDGFFVALKMGPGGYLYGARTRYIYRVSPDGSIVEKFGQKLGQKVNDFDFDENGNIFTASKSKIYCMTPDGTNIAAADYPDINLKSARVFNGYVYVAGEYLGFDITVVQKGIWRNEITSSAGDLGDSELVFDWGEYWGANSPSILAITFSEDGDMYIGAEAGDAITIVHPNPDGNYLNGDAEPLFPAVLMPPSTVFSWGNGQYLYVNRKSPEDPKKRLIRITMGKKAAPYYGRTYLNN